MTTGEPSPGPRRRTSRRLLLAGALVIVVVLVALSGYLILRSDPLTDGAEAIYDGSELTVELPDGASITVPAGAALPDSVVRAARIDPASLPELPPYASIPWEAWDFEVEGGILAPVTVRFPTPPVEQGWLLLHYTDGEWVPTEFELVDGQAVATLDSLSGTATAFPLCPAVDAVASLFLDDDICAEAFRAFRDFIAEETTQAIGWMLRIDPDPALCPNPDKAFSVRSSHDNILLTGCTHKPPEQNGGTAIVVKNQRGFYLDVYVSSGSATLIGEPLLPSELSCCGGENVEGWGTRSWFPHPEQRSVEVTGIMSGHSAIIQLAYSTLSVMPFVGKIDSTMLTAAYEAFMEINTIRGAAHELNPDNPLGGDARGAFETLRTALATNSEAIKAIAELFTNRKIVPKLALAILDPFFTVLDLAQFLNVVEDALLAQEQTSQEHPEETVSFNYLGKLSGDGVEPIPASMTGSPQPVPLQATQTATPAPTARPTPSPTATPTPTPTPPPTPTPSVSAGLDHTCAVSADGSVVCWGDDDEGQASPPGGEFLTVSAGEEHTCGILTDRSVVCWGRDHQGQSSAPSGRFVSVSAGWEDTCGVRTDGSLECWGRVTTFGLDDSPGALFRSVSVAQYHACGVMQDREVACWGYSHRTTSLPPGPFASVSAGEGLGCGLRTDGSVACWGSDDSEQVIAPSGTFVSISASTEGHRACGVRTDGSALCWGAGRLVPAGARNLVLPVSIQPDGRFSSISAGGGHVCGTRTGGDVACWGANEYQRGQAVAPGVPLVSVSPGDRHLCALRADGSIACEGIDTFSQTDIPPGTFVSLNVGHGHNCAIKADGSLICWGHNSAGQADAPNGAFTATSLGWNLSCGLRAGGTIECWGIFSESDTPPEGRFEAIATAINGGGCGLRPDGSVECWGDDLGDYAEQDESFTSIAAGWSHACGIRTDGTIACWGSNPHGEASPPDGRFVAITLGNDHSCGLRDGSQVECWGENAFGQTEAPDGTFTSINSWMRQTCAVRTDGSYVCWGQ